MGEIPRTVVVCAFILACRHRGASVPSVRIEPSSKLDHEATKFDRIGSATAICFDISVGGNTDFGWWGKLNLPGRRDCAAVTSHRTLIRVEHKAGNCHGPS